MLHRSTYKVMLSMGCEDASMGRRHTAYPACVLHSGGAFASHSPGNICMYGSKCSCSVSLSSREARTVHQLSFAYIGRHHEAILLACMHHQDCLHLAGAVDWAPHLPQLLTHIQWSFQVPVGGATAQSPIGEVPNVSTVSFTPDHLPYAIHVNIASLYTRMAALWSGNRLRH